MASIYTAIYDTAYAHTPERGSWHLCESALICLDHGGSIAAVVDRQADQSDEAWRNTLDKHAALLEKGGRVQQLEGFLVPGLVDCHIHAPQYTYTGNGLDLPLMQWLEQYTFPAEAKMSDTAWSREVYSRVVRRTLALGTTTACWFGTIHLDATLELAGQCATARQRAMVGLVSMDINSGEYAMEVDACVETVQQFIEGCQDERRVGTTRPAL